MYVVDRDLSVRVDRQLCLVDSIKTSVKWNLLSEAFPDFSKLY